MEINLGDERIVELEASFSVEQARDKALQKRIDAFGQLARFIQRPKPEDIELVTLQKRLEPFWHVAATARYDYDRRHVYHVDTVQCVRDVRIGDTTLTVTTDHGHGFDLEAIDHCIEEYHRELTVDAMTGQEGDLAKFLQQPQHDLPDMAALQAEGTVALVPEIRSSFVVRKVVTVLMKTFHADKIHEEKIDVEQLALMYRPVYAVEFLWKLKNKKQVVEFDGITGDFKAEGGEIKRQMARVLDNDALFDIGADAVGTLVPGANIAVKLGRLAARRVMR